MKKRTSNLSRRIVSLLMSMILTLTLVTPAAFATEVVGGSGTAIIEGNANPADANPNEDTEGKDDENKDTEHGGDEQPTNPGDEDKNPGEGEGDDANKPDEDKKDEAPDGENKDEENKDEQPTEDENNGEDDISLLNDENGTDVWDGTAVDTSWYAGHENETKFSIGTAAELAGLAALVNGTAKDAEGKPIAAVNFYDETTKTDKTIKLTADIDLGDKEWTPIGNGNNSFAFFGTFDGDGYTISGLNVPDANAPGLFGCIFGTVQNLIVKGSVTVGDEADNGDYWEAGGVVCDNNGTVQNCGFYGSVNDEIGLDAGGVAGGGYGKVLNCWYYMTDESSSVSKVSVCTATNCVIISSAEPMTADKLETLKTAAPDTGKVWSWTGTETEGTLYPKLIDPPKAITMQPVFPDCKAEVSANGTPLSATNGYTYEVTDDTVTIAVSGSSDAIYYAASESENAYTTEGENANLKKLESDTTFNKNTLPKTYYYGTLADFAALAAWNSVTKANDVITAHNQLKALARMVNSGKDSMTGRNFMLNASIDLSGIDWTPIGTAENPFKGTFTIMGNYSISNLPNDLFGVVEGGTVKSVTISGGTGRLVNTLKSGTVQYCMSTAKVTGSTGGLVGQNSGTVSSCYYYNADSKNTPAVGGSGTVTNCFYLADQSTFGDVGDNGARTEEEFKAGRVTWELGSSWGANASDNLPCLGSYKKLYQLTLTKLGDAGVDGVTIENDNALTNGDTQYLYGTAETEVRLKETISDGSTITYSPAKPEKIQDPKNNSTVNTYYYTIGEKVDADISWYKDADNEFTLTNAAELFGLAQLVNGGTNFANKTVKLGEDIDLIGYIWTPIGIGNYSFKGVFDGGNHKITSMNVHAAGTSYAGLFGYVLGGTVKNLRVEGSVKYTGGTFGYVGGIVGCCDSSGKVTNCLSKVMIAAQGNYYVGGVVGNLITGTINLCWNEGTVNGGSGSVGGIVGTNSGGTVTNCANFGEVTGSSTAGGIVGIGTAANSYNLGDVTGAEGRAYGISSQPATNSYYICKLNDAETAEMKYVDRETTKQDIATAEEDGKTVYAVDNDVLVNVLNKNKSRYIEWINKQDAPYNPVHITRWDGSFEEGVEGVITLIYEPNNGGVQTAVTEQQRVEGDTGSFTIKSDTELGFKHENGTFLGWSTDPRAKTADNRYAAGKTVSVEKDKTVTLYAVWENIWTGSGTEADAYQISNAADLTALQTQVNEKGFSYTGKWFRLTNNIDLNNELWTPIGVDSLHFFGGSLDGGGKTISGLKVETDRQWAGLFGSVRGTYGVPMTMRDLTLKNGSVKFTSSGTSCSGGLVAIVEGETALELRNVVAENLTVSGGDDSGGLLGRGRVAMTNCHNRGGSVTGEYAGGLAGKGHTTLLNHVFTGCTNSAKVVGERTAGGMTGNETYNDGSYTSCANSGSISAAQGYASGIAAGGSYERCSNSGAVTGQQAAGIASNGNKATFCSNTGAIKGTDYAAGILTNGGYGGTVEFCWNTGSVEASTPVKAFGILYGWGAYNRVRNSFSYVPGANIGLAPTELKEENVSDSYYLADKKDSVSSVGEWASADDFASGKVAWGVDGGVNAHKNYWTQGGSGYPIPIGEGTSTSYYRAQVTCGTGGTATIKRGDGRTGDADNAVYGPSGTKVTVTATPKDSSFALKSLTLDLMSTGTTSDLANPGSFALGAANAKVVATFASAGSGGGSGSGSGSGSGAGTGDENDEGLQDGMNMDVEYNVKGLVLSAYTEWGSNGGGKTFSKWLKDSPNVLRALIANSLDNMAAAAAAKKTDEASALAQALLASLNEHSGVAGKDGDAISKALQRFMTSGTEATFSTWLTTGSGMASGTVESIFTQYTDSLLALADRLYAKWESSGTSMTFPVWLDAQQVSMENLSETAEEPDTDTTNESQTTEAPEDVPDGQESEGQASGNSIWEIIGTAVRENPIIVWSIVAVITGIIIVGAVRRYHKVKRDERDDNGAE
mgnify:CR=1 FL=1